MASLPVAAPGGDAVLLDACAKYQASIDETLVISGRMEPLYIAAKASRPEHPFLVALMNGKLPAGTTRDTISEEQWEACEEIRGQQYQEAWDRHGLSPLDKEIEQILETVADPLAEVIRNTAPTTLEGVAAKARYLLEYGGPDQEPLRQFIEQLTALSNGSLST